VHDLRFLQELRLQQTFSALNSSDARSPASIAAGLEKLQQQGKYHNCKTTSNLAAEQSVTQQQQGQKLNGSKASNSIATKPVTQRRQGQ
jgi:hypothetical protein